MRSTIELHLGESSAWVEQGGRDPGRTELPGTDVERVVSELLVDRGRAPRASLLVRVHAPPAQIRTLRGLPTVGARDLNNMVALQQQRFFRPVRGGLETGAVWVTNEGERVARAAAVPMELVQATEAAARAAGVRVTEILVTDVTGQSIPIETTALHAMRRRSRARTAVGQLIVAIVPWLVVAGVYVGDLQSDNRALVDELNRLEPVLARLDQIESEVARFQPVVAALRGQSAPERWLSPKLVRVIEAVEPGAHLHRIEVDDTGRVSIEVHGGDRLDLVSALGEWWDGRIRLVADPGGADPDTPYSVIMEAADEQS